MKPINKTNYWLGLLIFFTLILVLMYFGIISGLEEGFFYAVFALWVCLLLMPLFVEIEFLGIKLKKEMQDFKEDVKGEIQSLKLEVKNTNNQQVIFGGYGPPPSDSKIPILEKEIEELKKKYNSDKSSIDPNASFFGPGQLNITGLKQKFDTPEVSMQLFQIRFNLEELITKIWNNYNEYFSQKNRVVSPTRMLNDLRDIDLLDRDIIGLTRDVLAICNAAIHGREVSEKQIEFVINNGKVIYNTLYDLVGNE